MAHFVHTHRTSCRRGWSRGFGALNSNPHSCIYFRLSVFQYSLLLIHFHDWPNWCLHCTKVGHKTYPILWRSTFEIDTAQSRSVTEIERRSVTSRYHGSTISGLQQNERRRLRQGKQQKNYIFILTNNNFARTSRYFAHFVAVVAPLRHETS